MEFYMIIDTHTQLPLRLAFSMETLGRSYQTYEEPLFELEQTNEYNLSCPVWTTTNKELAEAMLIKNENRNQTLNKKTVTKNLDNPEIYIYTEGKLEIVTLKA